MERNGLFLRFFPAGSPRNTCIRIFLPKRKRTFGFFLQSLKTLRFKLIHQPARLIKPQGYSVLRFSVAQPVQDLIQKIEHKLNIAA
jgi:hypothetical protein